MRSRASGAMSRRFFLLFLRTRYDAGLRQLLLPDGKTANWPRPGKWAGGYGERIGESAFPKRHQLRRDLLVIIFLDPQHFGSARFVEPNYSGSLIYELRLNFSCTLPSVEFSSLWYEPIVSVGPKGLCLLF